MALKGDEEEEKENYIGRSVKKYFAGFGIFHGKVVSFDREVSYYKIKYDDGDKEDLELKELKEILVEADRLPVGKLEVAPDAKPEVRRGRKRRRNSSGGKGMSEVRMHTGPQEIERGTEGGYIYSQDEKVDKHVPLKLEDVKVLTAETQAVSRKSVKIWTGEEGGNQEDGQRLEPLVPVSLFNRLDIPMKNSVEENHETRAGENREQTRTSHSFDSCLPQMTAVDHERAPAEDFKADGSDAAAAAEATKEEILDMADVPWSMGKHSIQWDLDYVSDLGKDGGDIMEAGFRSEGTGLGSLVLSLPPSSKSLGEMDHCVAELFQVYSFLRSFSNVIFLSPFSLEEFTFALSLADVSSMIDSVHLSLLQSLRRELERLSKHGSKSATFTLRLSDWSLLDHITWPWFLIAYLLTQGFTFDLGQSFVKGTLSAVEYYKLPVEIKLTILSFLCDKVLDTEEARAELARRASVEHDPEATESKGPLPKMHDKSLKDPTLFDARLEDELVRLSCPRQGNGPELRVGVQEISIPSGVSVLRVGRHLDEDGNLDECVLCAMDGNLLCCDGCPAAYHSRCVGVTRQGLPPGDWFCPECRADKQDRRGACISKGVRGGELLVVGPDAHLLFTVCGFLMISELGSDGQVRHRYYSPRDLPKVLEVLKEAGPNYVQLQIAVQRLCQDETSTAITDASIQNGSLAEAPFSWVSSLEKEAPHSGTHTQRSHAVESDSCQTGSDVQMNDKTLVTPLNFLVAPQETESDLQDIPVPSISSKDYEKKCDIQLHGSLTAMNGLNPDTLGVSPLPGEQEKERAIHCDDLNPNASCERLSDATNLTVGFDLETKLELCPKHEDAMQTSMDFTKCQDNEQISEDLKKDQDHIAQSVNTSTCRGLQAAHVCDRNATMGSPDILVNSIAQLGEGPLVHNVGWSAEGTSSLPAQLTTELKHAAHNEECLCPGSPGKAKVVLKDSAGRNSHMEEDYRSTLTQINACGYTNKYANCDFVANAAFNLAVMAGGVDALVEDKSGTQRKTKPWNVSDQLKAFTQASAHFLWPSSKKRAMDVSKEKCGWCVNCRSPIRRGCLLTQVVGQMAGGAATVVGGIRPVKGGCGHYPAVAAYILHMEETLHGLLVGPWDSPCHRKTWRKGVEQAKSVQDVKLFLLQMESNLRDVALSADWDKVEEDAPESIASSVVIVGGILALVSKKLSARKRGRPPLIPKPPVGGSYDGACFGVNWWRGGSLSRLVYNWESLPQIAIKRAGRQGGFKEISGLVYPKSSDLPRRSRRFAWRTRLKKISSIAQVALEVRYLDMFIKWNDFISPPEASTTFNIRGSIESDFGYRKAEIRAKFNENGTVRYLLGFPRDEVKTSVDFPTKQLLEIPTNCFGGSAEKPTNKKQPAVSKGGLEEGLWVAESNVPLFLLKEFEEKTRIIDHEKLLKFLKKDKVPPEIPPERKASFWEMLCSSRLAGVLQSKKPHSWICGDCKLSCSKRESVNCQRCRGKFHRKCAQVEDSINGREKVPVCKTCVRIQPGQRTGKPSYKMLAVHSQLADGSPVSYSEDMVVPGMLNGASEGGKKMGQKGERVIDFGTQQGRKSSLPLVATPSTESESTFLEERSTAKKMKKLKPLDSLMLSVGLDSSKVGRENPRKKRKELPLAVEQLLPHCENSLAQSRNQGRKKTAVPVGTSKSQTEHCIPPEGRRTSRRIRNSISLNSLTPLAASEDLKRGLRKAGLKLDKIPRQEDPFLSKRSSHEQKNGLAATTELPYDNEGDELGKSALKRKRVKVHFSGLEAVRMDASNIAQLETRKRKSGNGLDYGCRSSRSEADIQKFRRENLIVAGQVGLASGEAPVCSLCLEGYVLGQLFVSCEFCKGWYHGDAVGLNPVDAEFLVGFKCHRCRKCRAPCCPVYRNVEVTTKERPGIDHGEVIDAENANRTAHLQSGSPLQSSGINSLNKEFSAFFEAKAFHDFGSATDQVEAPLAGDSSNFGHDVLLQDFDMSDLVLQSNTQVQVAPLSVESEQVGVWAVNGSEQPDLHVFSGSQTDPSSQAASSLSFTELLASDDVYL